jgi:glycosyltransferase involved in cell wall biosynthesis
MERTGIGNYIHGLVQQLPRIAPQHEYFLYSNKEIYVPGIEAMVQKRVDARFGRCPGPLWLLGRGGALARKDKVDIFWATHPLLPFRIPADVVKIIVLYDLAWLRYPETMSGRNLLMQKTCARRAIAAANRIVVISRSTQDELVQLLGVPREKTWLVHPGISEVYSPQDPVRASTYISTKYRVPSRYMAAVGTIEPRKNLKLLVEALAILKRSGNLDCPLVIAGAKGWKNSGLFRDIQAAKLTEEDIRFLGYLPDEDLPSFYAGAQLFLFPSLYEGFGMPPVEAMACGTPVIASKVQPMPEVLGDAAMLESPTNPTGFASAILTVLGDEKLRTVLKAGGIRRARFYSWRASATRLLESMQ